MPAMARELTWFLWQWRLAWRMVTGRWYVFRDAPDFVVARCVAWADDESLEDDLREVGRQAIDELSLRIQRLRRDIEKATEKSA